ncbi:MAG: ABC transporter substrate-binding protein [Kiloniellales bacterium]|nr:ABC transporter substrate-binding protein [Kiloniellales bacterium]
MPYRRRTFLRAVSAATTAVGLIAAGLSPLSAQTASEGEALVVAVQALPTNLEPIAQWSNAAARIYYSVFDTLLEHDLDTYELRPGLAEQWSRIDDKTLEFTLRQNIRFHNGDLFDAEDVAFTFGKERMFDPESPGYGRAQALFGGIESVEVIDPYKVRIKSKVPDPILEHRFAGLMSQIISKEAYQSASDFDTWARSAIGSGPYKIDEIKHGEHIRLTAFDDHWRGQPPLESVTFKLIPEATTRIAGLLSGEFHIITDVPADQLGRLDSTDGVSVTGGPINNIRIVVYDEGNGVLADPDLRLALNYAIDRELIVESLFGGRTAVPPGEQFPFFNDMFIEDWDKPEFNPDKAREALKRSSYRGEEIRYRMVEDYYPFEVATAEVMQQMWRDVGINVKVEVVGSWDDVQNEETRQIYNLSSTMYHPDPLGHLWRLWGEQGILQSTWGRFSNDEFNDLGRRLESSIDLQERRKLFRRMLEIVRYEDPPSGVLHYLPAFYGRQDKVRWEARPVLFISFRPGDIEISSETE